MKTLLTNIIAVRNTALISLILVPGADSKV